MKTHALILAVLLCGTFLTQATGDEPASPTPEPVSAEFTDLRQKLGAIERSSRDAAEKFDAMSQQNAALSNVLTGLQQTLVAQKEYEVELGRQSQAFTLKIITGAAAAVFLVFLFSYWFQLRCLNRVMEISSSVGLPIVHPPGLMDAERPQNSALLASIKALENRIQHLELPSHTFPASNSATEEARGVLLNGTQTEAGPATANGSNVSLLLEKGQALLDTDRLQDALGCFQEASMVEPDNGEAHFRKGIALERMHRLEAALHAYEEAIRLNPRRAVAHAYKARILAALHRYDEAISVYDSALGKATPKNGTPMFTS